MLGESLQLFEGSEIFKILFPDFESLASAIIVLILYVDLLAPFILQVLVHNVMQISRSDETRQAHAFSLYLMQPLVATSLGLLAFNW